VSAITQLFAVEANARREGRYEVLRVAKEMLPAADYDELCSRLRERRTGAPAGHLSVVPAVEDRAQQPSQDGAA
jgi:hypothetical protein